MQVPNYHGLTPLVLAAQLGKGDMLQHIYSKKRRAFYTFGRVGSRQREPRPLACMQGGGRFRARCPLVRWGRCLPWFACPGSSAAGPRAMQEQEHAAACFPEVLASPALLPQVTNYSLALTEIDTVQDEEEYVPNALEVAVRKVGRGDDDPSRSEAGGAACPVGAIQDRDAVKESEAGKRCVVNAFNTPFGFTPAPAASSRAR